MMSAAANDDLVAKAEQKSQDLVHNYLMNEACDVYESHPPLIDYKKLKKEKKSKDKKKEKKVRKPKREGHKSDTSTASDSGGEEIEREAGSPVTFILDNLRQVSPKGKSPRTFCSLQMYDDFEEWTDDQRKGYDTEAISAIRSQDIDTLRKWHQEGRVLQAANAFGESLLHLACRRGFLDVVSFLVEEVGHNLWIRDDTGRTPLHDACWTTNACPELVMFILERESDLLLVTDKRGHTPLDYARKVHWQSWIDLFAQKDFTTLLPRRECFYVDETAVVPADITDGLILENLDDMLRQFHLEKEPLQSSLGDVPIES